MSLLGSKPGEKDKGRAPAIGIIQKVEEPEDRETDDHCGRIESFLSSEMWMNRFQQRLDCEEDDERVAEVGEAEEER